MASSLVFEREGSRPASIGKEGKALASDGRKSKGRGAGFGEEKQRKRRAVAAVLEKKYSRANGAL